MNMPLVRKLLATAAVACAALLIVVLLVPRATGPISSVSPSPSTSAVASESPVASESESPSPTASAVARYRLTVVVTGAQNGSVLSIPAGINCPTKCSALFPQGTLVQLMPMAGPPPTGYDETWMEWAELCPGEGMTCEATMTSSQTFHATFHLRPSSFALQVTVVGSGGVVTSMPSGIDCGSTCTGSFSAGEVTLTAIAAEGYIFTGWTGGGCAGTGTCTVSLGADIDVPPVEVTATFGALTPP